MEVMSYVSVIFQTGSLDLRNVCLILELIGIIVLPRPATKRAAALALINSLSNVCQIYTPYLYPSTLPIVICLPLPILTISRLCISTISSCICREHRYAIYDNLLCNHHAYASGSVE